MAHEFVCPNGLKDHLHVVSWKSWVRTVFAIAHTMVGIYRHTNVDSKAFQEIADWVGLQAMERSLPVRMLICCCPLKTKFRAGDMQVGGLAWSFTQFMSLFR